MSALRLAHEPPADFFADEFEGYAPGSEEAKPRFKIWTTDEIWAPLGTPEYAIGGLLQRGNLALMVATGSSLKTWAALALVISNANGSKWLARFPIDRPGAALFVDWESGDFELRRRLQAISPEPVPGVAFVSMPELYFNAESFERDMMALATGRSIIALDSLAAGTVDVDENDARFAKGLQILKRVGATTNCAFLVLHHSRKGKGDGGGDERDRPRGTGAIFAACDVVLQLEREADGAFLVKQTKARTGKAIDPFLLRVDDLDGGGVRVYADEPSEKGAGDFESGSRALDRAKGAVVQLLGRERDLRSKNEIFRRLKGSPGKKGCGRAATLDALEELLERGTVVVHDGRFRLASEVDR